MRASAAPVAGQSERHEIDSVHRQFGQEALGLILMTDDLIMRGESGFEQTIDDEFRQGV